MDVKWGKGKGTTKVARMTRNYGRRRLTSGLTLSSFSEEIACLISKLGGVMGYSP
jgi:hypothetical protein